MAAISALSAVRNTANRPANPEVGAHPNFAEDET